MDSELSESSMAKVNLLNNSFSKSNRKTTNTGSYSANLKQNSTENQPLKEGVRDLLIKHHLFSWDL